MPFGVAAGGFGVLVALAAAAPAVGSEDGTAAARTRTTAYFERLSYGPGDAAVLHVAGRGTAWVELMRVGPKVTRREPPTALRGVPVTPRRRVRLQTNGTTRVRVAMLHWPSGLYFARVRAAGGVAVAPVVLRASRFERRRVAVVLATNTWQAYNERDDDGDGIGNSWYASPSVTSVRLDRPFPGGGSPATYRYDRGFVLWLARTGRQADFYADDDFEWLTAAYLAARYDLIVFPGHEEYVTPREYDVVEAYRDAGGNLAFLSANNFYYRVIRSGNTLTKSGRWRDLGRPEASLVGVQYVGWNENRFPNAPYVVSGADAAPWLFRGTGLSNGMRFGNYGIEIDQRAQSSPPGTQVLATVPNVFGPGMSGEMTYYRTAAGAKVFAAGTLNFGASALAPIPAQMLENLWAQLTRP
jgi:hypothetical protein